MLTVLEPCDTEYRVRALLLQPRQGVTSLLIGDIRVPAAASYPHFRSLSLFFFLIYSLSLLPLHILSPSLALSLLLGSSLISSLRRPPSFAFQVVALCRSSPAFPSGKGESEREGERVGEKKRETGGERRKRHMQLMLNHGCTSRHLGPSLFFPMSTSMSLTGLI